MKRWRGVALGCVAAAAALAVVLTGAASATDTGPVASGGVQLSYAVSTDGSVDSIDGTDSQSGSETFSAGVANISDDGGDSSLDAGLTAQNPTITATGSLDQLDPPLTSPDSATAAALAPGDSLDFPDFSSSQLDSTSFQTGVDVTRSIQTLSCADTDQCVADDQLGSIDYSSCPTLGSLDGATDGDTAAASGDTLEIVTVSVNGNGTNATTGTLAVSTTATADDATSAGLTPTLIGCDLSGAGGGDVSAQSDTASVALTSLDSVTATFVFQIANSSESDVEYKPEVDVSTDAATDDSLDTTDTSADVTVADLGGDVAFSADNPVEWQLTRQSSVAMTLGGLVGSGGGGGGGTAPDGDGVMSVDTPEVGASTTGNTLTFDYVPDGDLASGSVTLRVPDGWSAPSTTASDPGAVSATAGDLSIVGRTIVVQNLTMSSGDDLTITYGDQSSGPGATAPSDAGNYAFDPKEASTSTGTLTDLDSAPTVTVDPLPQIDSVTDTTQDPNGMVGVVGDSVVITGSDLGTVSEVDFNGTSADINSISDGEIDTTVPDGATTGPVSVTNLAGVVQTDSSFIVAVQPSISTVTAASGAAPGKTATINGAHLDGTSEVDFGGVAATAFNVVSNTKITATIPNGAKTGKVRVVNPAGSALSSATLYIAPTISGLTPSSGPVGTMVTVNGSNLQGSTLATFGSKQTAINASKIAANGASLQVAVPSGATTGKVTIVNPGGSGQSSQTFTLIVAPAVSGFSPKSGPAGTKVSLTGSGFTGVTEVDFGGVAGTGLSVADDGHLTVNVPAGGKTGTITVKNGAGSGVSGSPFTVFVKPVVGDFSPKSGTPGTTVMVTGSGFTGVTEVDFGSTAGTGLHFTNDGSLTVNVPAGAATGKITVKNPAGNGVSSAAFTYVPPTPTITSFSPKTGPVGTLVTITGTNLAGTTKVAFGAVTATPASSSATQVSVKVPVNAISGKLTVTNNGKTSSASADTFTVTYVKPTITSLSTSFASFGFTITVNGNHFNGVQDPVGGGATIQGVAAKVTFVSDKQIKVDVPATAPGGAGQLVVMNTAGNASVAFTVLPSFMSFSPSTVKVGQTLKINGSGLKPVTSVQFTGGATAKPVSTTATTITVVIPAGAKTGTVTIFYPNGQSTSSIVLTITH